MRARTPTRAKEKDKSVSFVTPARAPEITAQRRPASMRLAVGIAGRFEARPHPRSDRATASGAGVLIPGAFQSGAPDTEPA